MISSSSHPDLHTTYTPPDYYNNIHSRNGLEPNDSGTLTRLPTNASALSYSSTTELVHEDQHKPHARNDRKPTILSKLFGRRCEKVSDSEKNASASPIKGAEGGEKKPKMRACQGWQLVFLGSWLNVLIILIPASWALQIATEESHTLIFIFCVLSMIPLVKLHDLATKDLAVRLGGSKTGLLNASLSNTVEIVVAIIALRRCELRVVQSTLIGTMLSKMLLVLGMCFFAGGLRFSEQGFDATTTQIHSSLLSISVGAVLMPAAFHFALTYNDEDAVAAGTTLQKQKLDILQMSHGVSIVLLFIYASYLLFQFWSHTHLFDDSTAPASSKLPHAASSRSMASRLQNTPSSATLSPIEKLKGKAATSSFNSPTLGGSSFRSIPYGRQFSQSPRNLSSSEESIDSLAKPNGPRNVNAFLISPYSSTSQVTVTVSDTHHTAPIQGTTIRLVNENNDSQAHQFPQHDDRDRRGMSNPDDFDTWNRGGPPGLDAGVHARSGAISPVDEVISSYLTNGGTEEAAKARRRAHHIVQSSMPYEEIPRVPQISWTLTLLLLTFVTVLVAVNAEWLVDSMDDLSPSISKEWIGLILLPTVSAVAECFTAMNVSVKDQLSLSISVAVGSTIQTALFVIPFMVILGWIIDKPLALLFDPFESVVLYISVHTMSYVVADGRSNWLEGVILVCLYVVIAVTFWFYPGSEFSSSLANLVHTSYPISLILSPPHTHPNDTAYDL
ncbi:Sodium/calcium exchanger protein-domain-containing protein [Cristinia sonorae]|uniref:Sodium/calcium exchanger protein-domain-containing protein n=1 Tax=Cristinia sonorae TaxID=1940300 RepID=A0A8K0UM80_9AGAR|nr:Sodium/calcium exchanger protein-domain-containing protein [Cristinia sonorae]